MRVIIVRHGEPDYENDCLTPRGHEQAKAVARRLQKEGIEKVYASSMGRAQETASYTAQLLRIQTVETLDFMRELDWGSTDGTPLFANGHPWHVSDELVRKGQNLLDPCWKDTPFFRTNKVTAAVERVAANTDSWLEEFGYRREGLYYRDVRCELSDNQQRTIALFCHGGSSSAMIAHILNLTFPYVCAVMHADFTAITVLKFDSTQNKLCIPTVEIACDARHIKQE